MPTGSLRLSPSASPLEVAPLARLLGGELVLLGPEFPPAGDLVLVLWRPGASPPFSFVEARIVRDGHRWRLGATAGGTRRRGCGRAPQDAFSTQEGYVVLWGPAPGHPERGS